MDEVQKKKKILIVEDDKFLLDMYITKFNELGYEITASVGGIDAIAKLEEGLAPDAILTDIVMPTMDGFEFLEEVKKKNLSGTAVVIVLSNLGQKQDVEKATALGAHGYIVKATSTPSEVVEKVSQIIEKAKNNPSFPGEESKGSDDAVT